MNIGETSQALALAQAYDNRTVGEMNVRAWHSILGDLDAADVMEAIRRHYAGQTDWMMPVHVRRGVEQIELERARAARKWAPGQAGVAPEDALPEIERGPTLSEAAIAGMPPELRAFLNEMAEKKGLSPQQARESLAPRREHWEREQRAFLRAHSGEPNPLYRPKAGWVSENDEVPPTGRDYRPLAATADTGIFPNAYRCTDCTFTSASADRMDGHMSATGHRCEGLDD